jgi:hypothetical protein
VTTDEAVREHMMARATPRGAAVVTELGTGAQPVEIGLVGVDPDSLGNTLGMTSLPGTTTTQALVTSGKMSRGESEERSTRSRATAPPACIIEACPNRAPKKEASPRRRSSTS